MIPPDNSQYLLIDADDTLWENNLYFERVIRQVMVLLEAAGAEVYNFRVVLDDTERKRIPINGYGTVNFTRSLVETFNKFLPANSDPLLPSQAEKLSLAILEHPLEVFEGVPETLRYLSSRHTLFLVTKGDRTEQLRKIRDSNLEGFFKGVEILAEKNIRTYSELVARHRWDLSRTWMVGNSPRSDVNPALMAGMKAVYIPHEHTWTLEHEEPLSRPGLLVLSRFPDLVRHF